MQSATIVRSAGVNSSSRLVQAPGQEVDAALHAPLRQPVTEEVQALVVFSHLSIIAAPEAATRVSPLLGIVFG